MEAALDPDHPAPYTIEYRVVLPDGTMRWVKAHGIASFDTPGRKRVATSFVGTVEDVTERKLDEERVALANRKLALMNDVAYQDIKNKVTAARGYVELSRDAPTEDLKKAILDKEQEVLSHIHELIEKTKDYQQMGIDQSRWVLLEPLIREEVEPLIQDRMITLEVDLRGLALFIDPLFDRVVHNPLENAVVHGRTVTRISFRYGETPAGLMLFCEDNGVGVPLKEKDRIFRRIVGGRGKFGFFFVHEFLTISGVTIRETGEQGKGARFEIGVPKGMYRFEAGK